MHAVSPLSPLYAQKVMIPYYSLTTCAKALHYRLKYGACNNPMTAGTSWHVTLGSRNILPGKQQTDLELDSQLLSRLYASSIKRLGVQMQPPNSTTTPQAMAEESMQKANFSK